jgi:hypothetical protein
MGLDGTEPVDHIMHPDEYAERITEVRRRLADLLDPRTEQERELVTWLGEHVSPRLCRLGRSWAVRRSISRSEPADSRVARPAPDR